MLSQGPSLQNLRASCQFCRRRKIKCSGELSGCLACSGRNQLCVYETSAPMGRPRKNLDATAKSPTGKGKRGGSSMSKMALGLAAGEAEARDFAPEALDELESGMLKLRLTSVRSTFEVFQNATVGTIVNSFFGLVSSSADALPPTNPRGSYRAPQGLRFLYELAFQSRRAASRPRTKGATKVIKEAATHELWKRFPSELVSLSTAGIPSSYDDNLDEPLFVRLLQEDQSTPFHYPSKPGVASPPNPLDRITPLELLNTVTNWFLRSPLSFLVNDALFLESLSAKIFDPALLSIIVGISLARNDNSTLPVLPYSTSTSPLLPVPSLDPEPFLSYGEYLLFSQPTKSAADSLESAQALMILGAYYGANHMARRSWSTMSSGSAIARECLSRVRQAIKNGEIRTEVQKVRDEMLINVLWVLSIFGGWCFLSLDLPRSTLVNLADSLPLPPLHYADSVSYIYRSQHPRALRECTSALETTLTGFSETCRTLSIVVALCLKNGPPGLARNEKAVQYPRQMNDHIHASRALEISVATWLVNIAEEYSAPPVMRGQHNSFLSCVHAIMALHRLAPFNKPSSEMVLSAAGLKLAMRAMEILILSATNPVKVAMDAGNGQVLFETAKTGLLRLIGDSLPHCLRFMDHLAESAKTLPEVYALLFEEQSRISQLLNGLIFLTDSGLTVAGSDANLGARRVERSLARVRASPHPASNKRPLSPTSSITPQVRIPPPPAVPGAHHFRSLSDRPASPTRTPSTTFSIHSIKTAGSSPDATNISGYRSRSASTGSQYLPQRAWTRDRAGSSGSVMLPSPASFASSGSSTSFTSDSTGLTSPFVGDGSFTFSFAPGEQWGATTTYSKSQRASELALPSFPEEDDFVFPFTFFPDGGEGEDLFAFVQPSAGDAL